MSFFSLDSKFSQIMGRVFDLMMLNIIFLIMCIPIVTIGANFTAMYYVTLKMIKNEETYIFRTYWKSFRENFKQATAIWLILLAVLIVLILDLLLVMRMPGTITYLRFVFLVLIFFEAMVLSYVFPVLSRFDNTVKKHDQELHPDGNPPPAVDHHDPARQSLSAADLCILHDKDCQLSDSSDVPSGLFYGSAWMLLVLRKQNLPILYA